MGVDRREAPRAERRGRASEGMFACLRQDASPVDIMVDVTPTISAEIPLPAVIPPSSLTLMLTGPLSLILSTIGLSAASCILSVELCHRVRGGCLAGALDPQAPCRSLEEAGE